MNPDQQIQQFGLFQENVKSLFSKDEDTMTLAETGDRSIVVAREFQGDWIGYELSFRVAAQPIISIVRLIRGKDEKRLITISGMIPPSQDKSDDLPMVGFYYHSDDVDNNNMSKKSGLIQLPYRGVLNLSLVHDKLLLEHVPDVRGFFESQFPPRIHHYKVFERIRMWFGELATHTDRLASFDFKKVNVFFQDPNQSLAQPLAQERRRPGGDRGLLHPAEI